MARKLANAAATGTCELFYAFRPQRSLLVGGDGIPVEEFLSRSVEHWLRP